MEKEAMGERLKSNLSSGEVHSGASGTNSEMATEEGGDQSTHQESTVGLEAFETA